MSLWEVITGKQPLLRPRGQTLIDVERGYQELINSTRDYHFRRFPNANPQAYVEAEKADNATRPRASARYTLTTRQPVKVCDTQGETRKVFFTVIGVGTTAFVSHDRIRLQNNLQGTNEGVPITSNVNNLGSPQLTAIEWNGEMWAIGDTDGMLVDVEMS